MQTVTYFIGRIQFRSATVNDDSVYVAHRLAKEYRKWRFKIKHLSGGGDGVDPQRIALVLG